MRQALEASLTCGIAAIGPDGRQTYVNPRFCEMVGWTPEELLGAWPPFVYWPAEERETIARAFETTLKGQAPAEGFELMFQHRSGERFPALMRVAAAKGGAGYDAGWVASITDITERKRANQRRLAEHEVSRIVSRAVELKLAAPEILRAIGENLGWDLGVFWSIAPDESQLKFVDLWRRAPGGEDGLWRADSLPRGRGLLGRVWSDGEPAWCGDVHDDSEYLRLEAARAEGIQSGLAFPVIADSKVAGVIEFYSRDPRRPDPELITSAAALGRQIGQFIIRERTAATLRQSEERYRAIVETANDGVWLIDTSGRTLYTNHRIQEMLGYSGEELQSLTPVDLCFPEDVHTALQRMSANMAGRSEQFDFRFRNRDGAEVRVLAGTSPMRDAAGVVTGALGMFSDVTDRKRADEAIHRLAAIVESSDDAIISKTLSGVIETWNSGAERIYGYTAEEAIGRSMTILLPPDRQDEETGILSRLQRGERVDHFETTRMRKDGTLIEVSTTISPVRDKSGRIIGASSVTRDITGRRRFEEQLRETQKLESLGVLAGGVAHDFNNLLVGIMGNASLALDTIPLADPAHAMIDGVLRASERAAALTSQLLAYSGKGRFVIQRVDVSSLVRDIITLIQASISKGVRLELALAPDLPAVEVDLAQMQQLVMNLVINAAEAIGDARGTVTVRTGVERSAEGRFVRLEVSDNGCGMDEETKKRIFDPFFTTKFTGRGLGLAATLGIVRGHNGSIRVDTAPGAGSTFTVLLPASDDAVETVEERPARDLRGVGTVLVIDDEDIVRMLAQTALERLGYTVVLAEDGTEAVERVRERSDLSLVLLDLTMPVMGGEETLREIKKLRPELPVVLSSGFSEADALRRFEGEELAGFLQKPYTAERLAEKVKALARAAA